MDVEVKYKHQPLDLFNASPNPYILVDPDLTIADANDAYLRVTRSRREDIIGRYLFEAFPSSPTEVGSEAVRIVRESILRAFETKRVDVLAVVRFDMPVRRADGSTGYEERYWSATHTPILNGDGEASFVLQHTVDITELHRLRQQSQRRQADGGSSTMVEGDVLRRAEQVHATNLQLEADLQRLTELFNLAPSFIAVLRGPDHVFELANDSYLKIVGGREIIGKPVHQALPEVEGQGFFGLLDQVFNSGQAVVQRAAPVDLQGPAGDLQRLHLDFVYQPMIGPGGRVNGIFVEGHDVTEQVTARKAQDRLIGELEAAKERLSRALSTGRVGVFEWAVDKDVLSVSGSIAQYFGVDAEDAEAGLPLRSFMQGIHEEDQERVAAAVQRTVETGEPYEVEYRLRGVEGAIRSVIVRGHIEETATGQRRFIGVLIDVTEQKAAEQAIVDASQRLRLALEASRMGDWSWDPVRDTVKLSERAAEIFGASSLETTWARLQRRIHPDDRAAVLNTVEQAAREGSSYAIEYRVRHGSPGPEYWVASRGRVSYDAQGRLAGMFGIVEDISARKKAEEAQTILLREVDHRAKNVLAVVQSLIKMTPFRGKEDYLEVLSGRIHALARAHSLLSGNRWLGASLADSVRQELLPYAAEEERFILEGPPVEIRARGTQPLSLVLHELATNAAKHGAFSRPEGRVDVRWSIVRGGGVEISWREVGGQNAGRPGAPGFGSRLIAGAARQLQAEIEQEWLRDGLNIVIRLPADVATPGPNISNPAESAARQGGALPAHLRVLIVEDEALIAMDMEEALVRAGANVVATAYTLEEALARLQTESPDVAVVDMDLRGESALPLVDLLRSKGRPFVVTTGFEQPNLRHDCILRKPVAHERLIDAVSHATSRMPRQA